MLRAVGIPSGLCFAVSTLTTAPPQPVTETRRQMHCRSSPLPSHGDDRLTQPLLG